MDGRFPVTGTEAVRSASRGFTVTTVMYKVNGIMCESCLAAVVDKVRGLPGVTDVVMDLVTGGQSPLIVTGATTLGAGAVRDAIGLVGFDVPRRAGEVGARGVGPASERLVSRPDRESRLSSIGGLSS